MYHYFLISMLISLDLYLVQEFTDAEIILLESDIPYINVSCPAKVGTSSLSTFQVSVSYSDGRVLQIGQCNYTHCESFAQKNIIITKNSNSFDISINNINLQQIRAFSQLICKLDEVTTNYSIDVIAIPINSSCDTPRLTDDSTSVSMTCRSLKVFPQAKCLIHFSNKTAVRFGTLKYEHIMMISSDQVYYESKCTWISNISNFDAGAYIFFVTILPNVTDNRLNGQNITSLSLNLTLPSLQISKECFDGNNVAGGYIKPNATLNCLCFLEYVGNPPGSVKWLDSNGVDYGTKANYTFTYLNILPMHDLNTYYCTGITGLRNGTIFHSYNVKYAYGPNSCQLQLESTTFDLCYNKNILVNISCSVKNALVVPGYTLIFHVNGTDIPSKTDNQVLNSSTAQTAMNITSAGDAFFKCVAQNSKFEDVQTSCEKIMIFKEPPLHAPLLTITNISRDIMKAVQEEKIYNVTCIVSHGIPLVSNITIMCGNITKATKTGNVFTSPVTFTRNMTGQYCACEAQHITGCYINNSSLVKLNITYKSTVTSFTVSNTVIDKGNFAPMFCAADGLPAPNISISKGNETIAYNSSGYFLFINKSMSCKDAGNYLCQANNGIDFNNQEFKQVTIFVTCPLQFKTHEILKTFSLQKGEFFFYDFAVYGYPEPDTFRMLKSNIESNNVIVTKSSMEPPYVSLELKIFNMTSSDFDNYTLVIFQSGAQSLIFTFSIYEVLEGQINKPTTDNVAAIVGGSIAACVLVVIIIVAAFITRKYEIICRAKQLEQSPKHDTYFDMSVKENDLHSYAVFSNNAPEASEYDQTTTFIEQFIYEKVEENKTDKQLNVPAYNNVNISNNVDPFSNTVRIDEQNREKNYNNGDISAVEEKRTYNNVQILNNVDPYNNKNN